MKTLAIIWAAVVISAIGTVTFVNAEINKRVAEVPSNVSYLQASPESSQLLQPAGYASGNFTETYNPQQTAPASVLETATEIR